MILTMLMFMTAPAAEAPAPAAAAAAPAKAPLDADTPIETIAANPEGKAVLDKEMPNLLAHPAYEQIKSMSLRQLQPYSNGAITDEAIANVDAALKALN